MNPVQNPYAPGAGTRPPELAGRQGVLDAAHVALERIRLGRPHKNVVLVGLRGVGKTALLDRIGLEAEGRGVMVLRMEAPENRSLPSILVPQLRWALLKLSRKEGAKHLAQRALRGVAGFVSAFKVKYHDIEVGLDLEPEPGLADNGDLETDLQSLLEAAGAAVRADGTCIALFIDEVQYVREEELGALIAALHRMAQLALPVTLVGAGLPQARGRLGRAKSYSERLFDFPEIGALSPEDAKLAIAKPARREGVEIEEAALDAIVLRTRGYPYFLQEWGKRLWDVAEGSPIGVSSVESASTQAIADLDANFFMVRFDRLTPAEKNYLRGMASLGEGPHRSGDIARALNRKVSQIAPTRDQLINKGMVWSPSHGDTAFTVPMFDEFMRRIMPGEGGDKGVCGRVGGVC